MDQTEVIMIVAMFTLVGGFIISFFLGWFWQFLTERKQIHLFLLLVIGTCSSFVLFLVSTIIFSLYVANFNAIRSIDIIVLGIPLSMLVSFFIGIIASAYTVAATIVGGRYIKADIKYP